MAEFSLLSQQITEEKQNSAAIAQQERAGFPNSAMAALLRGAASVSASASDARGRREELTASIENKMSRAFGMDLSALRLYRSDALKGSGLQGLSSGNQVILASDVNLNTTAGQAVLGHELSHIRAQNQGIGLGHRGLLNDASLERQADIEGQRAAWGLSATQNGMQQSVGLAYGLGMQGVEGLMPIGTGLSASAGAPMQAKKGGQKKKDLTDAFTAAAVPDPQEPEDPLEEFSVPRQNAPAENSAPQNKSNQSAPAAPEGGAESNDGISPDLKKVAPLAWVRPTSGNQEEGHPTLGVHIKQQERGKGSEAGSLGVNSHAFLSLEYSKKSRSRGGNRRFRSAFGFYPMGHVNPIGVVAQGGTTAGQLIDDTYHASDVSRSYPITFAQLNTIAREASTYANGGYNLFKRNCTTFAAEVTKKAGVNTGNIFKEEDWTLGPLKRTGMGILKGVGSLFSKDSFSGDVTSKVGQKDLRYGVNRDLATQEDVDRYQQTRKRGGVATFGYSPSATGERMRASGIGGLASNFGGGDNDNDREWISQLEKTNLQSQWEKAAMQQATRSGPEWKDDVQDSLLSAFSAIDQMQDDYSELMEFNIKTDREQKASFYESYTNMSPIVYDSLQSWYNSYAQQYPILGDFVSDLFGKIRYLDTKIMETFPNGFAEPGGETEVERAFSYINSGNSEAISHYARNLAIGVSEEEQDRYKQLSKLANKEHRTAEEEEQLEELRTRNSNRAYLKTMIYDLVDDRMDRYEKNGVQQKDLDEAFIDIPLAELPDSERFSENTTNVMNNSAQFDTFSDAMQSASLRMLFGEQPVTDQLKEGGLLGDWLTAENLKEGEEEDSQLESVFNGVHDVTKSLLQTKNKEIRMVMCSLLKSPDYANFSAFDLAVKTLNVIEAFYITPIMMEHIKGQQSASDKIGNFLSAQNTQQAVFSSEVSYKEDYQRIKEAKEKGDQSFTGKYRSIPKEELIDVMKSLAQEIINERDNKVSSAVSES